MHNIMKSKSFVVLCVVILFCIDVIQCSTLGKSCSRSSEEIKCDRVYVCRDGYCSHCEGDDECRRIGSGLVCRSGKCESKALFGPFTWRDGLATIIAFVAGSFATAAGVGGGGIYVPTYLFILGFTPHEAIPLSKASVFGAALSTFYILSKKKHPFRPKVPLIDYDSATLLEPMVLLGAVAGVYLNILFPSWLIIFFLFVTLGFASYKTFKKGRKLWKSESMNRILMYHEMKNGMHASLVESESEDSNDGMDSELREVLKRDERRFPWDRLCWLGVAWSFVFLIAVVRGGKELDSIVGIENCSAIYWVVVVSSIPCLVIVTFGARRSIVRDHAVKLNRSELFPDIIKGSIMWTSGKSAKFPLFCIGIGSTTSLLGIGGGMLLGPLLLSLNQHPTITSSTTTFTVLFTASSTSLQYFLLGRLRYDYGLWFLSVTFLAGLIGRAVIGHFLKKRNRVSPVVLLLATIIGVSCVLLVVLGIMRTVKRIESGDGVGFHAICE